MAPGVPVAEGTTYTAEDVGYLFAASFVVFGTIRVLLEKLVIPLLWPPFNKLEPNVQKDFCVRCVSVVHSVISTYNSYWVLIDADLRANPLDNENKPFSEISGGRSLPRVNTCTSGIILVCTFRGGVTSRPPFAASPGALLAVSSCSA